MPACQWRHPDGAGKGSHGHRRRQGTESRHPRRGRESITEDGRPTVLQTLGDRSILDCVLENALQVVLPKTSMLWWDTGRKRSGLTSGRSSVMSCRRDRSEPGTPSSRSLPSWRLPRQSPDSVWRHAALSSGFHPGLLNRHRLRKAHLTLLTAIVDRPLPYGRIIRDAGGQIIDIIEETEASPEVREIRELNVGAYAVDATAISAALKNLSPSPLDENTAD